MGSTYGAQILPISNCIGMFLDECLLLLLHDFVSFCYFSWSFFVFANRIPGSNVFHFKSRPWTAYTVLPHDIRVSPYTCKISKPCTSIFDSISDATHVLCFLAWTFESALCLSCIGPVYTGIQLGSKKLKKRVRKATAYAPFWGAYSSLGPRRLYLTPPDK